MLIYYCKCCNLIGYQGIDTSTQCLFLGGGGGGGLNVFHKNRKKFGLQDLPEARRKAACFNDFKLTLTSDEPDESWVCPHLVEGSGGMLPRKILNFRSPEWPFPAI